MKIIYEISKIEIIAIYGAILSTIVLVWNIFRYRKDRAIIKVTYSYAIIPDYLDDEFLCIKAVNIGRRQTVITYCKLELPDKKNIVQTLPIQTDRLPFKLEENEFYVHYFNLTEIKRMLNTKIILKPCVEDASGNIYYGKKIGISP